MVIHKPDSCQLEIAQETYKYRINPSELDEHELQLRPTGRLRKRDTEERE